jgi:signal transduction histidine kinase
MNASHTERLVAFTRTHETTADVALALGVLLVSLTDALAEQPHPLPLVAFSAALALPLVWRRRSPMWVFAALAAVAGAQWIFDVKVLADAALLVGLYTVTAHEPRRRAALATGVLALGAVLATARWGSDDAFKTFVGLSGLTLAAAGLGTSVRQRHAYQASLEERAAAAERARIAREMHDIVAHNLSVMIALADGAAFAAERSPAQSATAMQAVSATGRQALGEMRGLLGVLRDGRGAGELVPQPGLGDIDLLVGQVRAAGLPVAIAVEGEVRELPAGAQLTVFRVVQEALTNSLKHAGAGAQALVRLRYDAAGVDVEISDDGAGVRSAAHGAHGLGLNGMRERAAVYAGTVEAGPLSTGGWRVHTRLAVESPGAGT